MVGFLGVSGVFVSNALLETAEASLAEASLFYVPDPCRVFEKAKTKTSNILNHQKYKKTKVAVVLRNVGGIFKNAQNTVDQVNNLLKWLVSGEDARKKIEAAQNGLNKIRAEIQGMDEKFQEYKKPLEDEKGRISTRLDQMHEKFEKEKDKPVSEMTEEEEDKPVPEMTEEERENFEEWLDLLNRINNISIADLQKKNKDFITSGLNIIIQEVDQIITLFQKA